MAPAHQPPPYFDAPYIEPSIPETQPIMSADVAEAVRVPTPVVPPPSAPVKPEPLAGPNVMKVVLVGAECAPWSKTGAYCVLPGVLLQSQEHLPTVLGH